MRSRQRSHGSLSAFECDSTVNAREDDDVEAADVGEEAEGVLEVVVLYVEVYRPASVGFLAAAARLVAPKVQLDVRRHGIP